MSGSCLIWRGFGDSEIGPLHRRLGLVNQDAYHLELQNEPVLIAISDGLGSKPLSQLGAQAVCRAVISVARDYSLKAAVEPLSLLQLFHNYWLDELQNVDIDQCSCTALFAIVLGEQTFIAQLGDGDCCIVTSTKELEEPHIRFLLDKNEDLFANQTHSLGSQFEANKWRFFLCPTAELEACFLVTDGIADDLDLERRIDFYTELLMQYRQLPDDEVKADVRSWISQWPVVGHSDDKTIVALYR